MIVKVAMPLLKRKKSKESTLNTVQNKKALKMHKIANSLMIKVMSPNLMT